MQLISKDEVLEILKISQSTLRRMMMHQGFPRPIPVGRRRKMWGREEVQGWIDEQFQIKFDQEWRR